MTPPDPLAAFSLNLLLWVAGQHGADVLVLYRAVGYDPASTASSNARLLIATIGVAQ